MSTPLLSPSSPLPGSSRSTQQSVSLKIGSTSVMLYANCYRKPNDGAPGFSTQEYLGSFSVNATEVPADFDALLRKATDGRPQRYLELYERIKTRVLEPARQRQMEIKHLQQRERILGMLGFARQQLDGVGSLTDVSEHLDTSDVQDAVTSAVISAQRLLRNKTDTEGVDPPLSSKTATEASGPAEPHPEHEQRLRELLTAINESCAEIAQMMPEAAKRFRRGYPFETETVKLVQQLWFRTSDAVAALNGRGPLKRPKEWDCLRSEVMPQE